MWKMEGKLTAKNLEKNLVKIDGKWYRVSDSIKGYFKDIDYGWVDYTIKDNVVVFLKNIDKKEEEETRETRETEVIEEVIEDKSLIFEKRDRRIARLSVLRTAGEIVSKLIERGLVKGNYAEITINLAKKFEKYVYGDENGKE